MKNACTVLVGKGKGGSRHRYKYIIQTDVKGSGCESVWMWGRIAQGALVSIVMYLQFSQKWRIPWAVDQTLTCQRKHSMQLVTKTAFLCYTYAYL